MENSAIFRMRVRRSSGLLLKVGMDIDGVGTGAGVGTDGAVVIVVVTIWGFLSGQRWLRWPCLPQLKHWPSFQYFSRLASVVAFWMVLTSIVFGSHCAWWFCKLFCFHVKGFILRRWFWNGEYSLSAWHLSQLRCCCCALLSWPRATMIRTLISLLTTSLLPPLLPSAWTITRLCSPFVFPFVLLSQPRLRSLAHDSQWR